jgi:sodium-dependent phosphate transporter
MREWLGQLARCTCVLRARRVRAQAEKFPEKAEVVFKYMQIMTACFDSFAHGANDVANAVGPFSALWFVYRHNGDFSSKNNIGADTYW